MVPLRLGSRAAWITLVDASLLIAASAAVVLLLGGRTRLEVAGLRVVLRSITNPLLFVAAASMVRLWLGRGLRFLPSLTPPRGDRFVAERARFIASAAR